VRGLSALAEQLVYTRNATEGQSGNDVMLLHPVGVDSCYRVSVSDR